MAKIGSYMRLLLLLKYSLVSYKTDRSTNKKYLGDSNFEMHLYFRMNLLILIGMKEVF